MEQRLAAIEILSAESLVLRRHLVLDAGTVLGHAETGWVVVQETAGQLKVYVSNAAIEAQDLPYKLLSDRLMDLCQIDAVKEIWMILILSTNNDATIQDMLERANLIPDALALREVDVANVASSLSNLEFSRMTGLRQDAGSTLSLPSPSQTRLGNHGHWRFRGTSSGAESGVIDISRVLTAAETFNLNSISILGSMTMSSNSSGDLASLDLASGDCGHVFKPTMPTASGTFPQSDAFPMSTLSSALAATSSNNIGPASNSITNVECIGGAGHVTAATSQVQEWQQDIGSKGEMYVSHNEYTQRILPLLISPCRFTSSLRRSSRSPRIAGLATCVLASACLLFEGSKVTTQTLLSLSLIIVHTLPNGSPKSGAYLQIAAFVRTSHITSKSRRRLAGVKSRL